MSLANESERDAQYERDIHLAYERGREESSTFPALLCGTLTGAVFVLVIIWIL